MKAKLTKRTEMRLGKDVKNALGWKVPIPCRACGCVWKLVTTWRKGRKVVRRRVNCYTCGKRQYGRRAKV